VDHNKKNTLQGAKPITDSQAEAISKRMLNEQFGLPINAQSQAAPSGTDSQTSEDQPLAKALENVAHVPASTQYRLQNH